MSLPLILLLYVVGLFLLFAELFVPGGVIGLSGLFMVGYAVYESFVSLTTIWVGVGMILFVVTVVPVVAWSFFKKHLLTTEQGAGEYVAADSSLADLVGKTGVSLSVLRPAGIGEIDGRRVDMVSQNRFIEPDTPIEVVEVKGMRVVVRETNR